MQAVLQQLLVGSHIVDLAHGQGEEMSQRRGQGGRVARRRRILGRPPDGGEQQCATSLQQRRLALPGMHRDPLTEVADEKLALRRFDQADKRDRYIHEFGPGLGRKVVEAPVYIAIEQAGDCRQGNVPA